MTHNSGMPHGYAPMQNYYMEEQEEYAQEYSEGEGLPENPQMLLPSNITEIYSRKAPAMAAAHQMVPSEAQYHQDHLQYMQHCYYENIRQAPQRPQVPTPQPEYTYDPRIQQYSPLSASAPNTSYELAHNPMAYQETVHVPLQKPGTVKKYPVTVGTPKYYRRPQTNSVYKKPSVLCLPVPSQPDPAVCRKPRKSFTTEVHYHPPHNMQTVSQPPEGPHQRRPIRQQQGEACYMTEVANTHRFKKVKPATPVLKIDSEGDLDLEMSADLDEMLHALQNGNESIVMGKPDLAKFAKFLKPRVPASQKARQERVQQTLKAKMSNAEKCATGDATLKNCNQLDEAKAMDVSVEKLLNQLKKCDFKKDKCKDGEGGKLSSRRQSRAEKGEDCDRHGGSSADKTDVTDEENKKGATGEKSPFKSFNYQDISDQMLRSQNGSKCFGDVSTEQSSIQDITKRITSSLSEPTQQRSRLFVPKPPLDDICALELHRSKSYIVNLIDRALSKELGTVPSERRKEFDNMNPRKAINLMNRHGGMGESKDVCLGLGLEIASALTDSIISSGTAQEMQATGSKAKVCCCNAEEPTYIKQLKQLRWGHLKHIRREVKRLEDLERFLDAASSLNNISEL